MRVETFNKRIDSVMRDNWFDREQTGFRSGKIDEKSYRKLMTGSDRVFKRKVGMKNKRYNILLVIDESGSMSERTVIKNAAGKPTHYSDTSRIEMVAKFTSVLMNAFKKNNIGFAVIGYHDDVIIFKEYSEDLLITDRDALERTIVNSRGGNNNEKAALKKAREIQSKTGEGNNITVFMSDGGFGYRPDEMKHWIHELERYSKVIPVGIGTNDMAAVFSKGNEVQTEEEFMTLILKELGKSIQRG